MNLSITFIVSADKPVVEQLEYLLPAANRPIFDEDVKSEWFAVYKAIEWLEVPYKIERKGKVLRVEWAETEHSNLTIKNALKKAGVDIEFVHAIEGDSATADEDSGEDDPQGVYLLNVNGELQPLNRNTLDTLLPESGLQWLEDIDENSRQFTDYLMDNKAD